MIKPSIGRVVWFWFTPGINLPPDFLVIDAKQPCNASVAYVWGDRMVNLTVSDHYGKTFNFTSVQLLQDDDPRPLGYFAEWMPFQVGQAKALAAASAHVGDAPFGGIDGSRSGLAETDPIDKPI